MRRAIDQERTEALIQQIRAEVPGIDPTTVAAAGIRASSGPGVASRGTPAG